MSKKLSLSHSLGALALVGVVSATAFLATQGSIPGLRSSSLGDSVCSIDRLEVCSNQELDTLAADLTGQIAINTQALNQFNTLVRSLDACYANPSKVPEIASIQGQLLAIENAEKILSIANRLVTNYESSNSNVVIDQGKNLTISALRKEINTILPLISSGTPQITNTTTVATNNQRIKANTKAMKQLKTNLTAATRVNDRRKISQLEADIARLTSENTSITRLNTLQNYLTKLTKAPAYTSLVSDAQAKSAAFLTLAGPDKSNVTTLKASLGKLQAQCEADIFATQTIVTNVTIKTRQDLNQNMSKITQEISITKSQNEQIQEILEKRGSLNIPDTTTAPAVCYPTVENNHCSTQTECDPKVDPSCSEPGENESLCGNAIIDSAEEVCDDGKNNGVPPSLCSADCQFVSECDLVYADLLYQKDLERQYEDYMSQFPGDNPHIYPDYNELHAIPLRAAEGFIKALCRDNEYKCNYDLDFNSQCGGYIDTNQINQDRGN